MISEITTLVLAILGIIFLLYTVMFKVLSWKEESVSVVIPLYSADFRVTERINNIRSFAELCGIHKKCTIVVVNYGAPEWFLDELLKQYENYTFLKIVGEDDTGSELREYI